MSVEQWELDQLAYERQVRRASRLVGWFALGIVLLALGVATVALFLSAG